MHMQDLAGVAHDDNIDPSVFSISGDEQMVGKTSFRVLQNILCKCYHWLNMPASVHIVYNYSTNIARITDRKCDNYNNHSIISPQEHDTLREEHPLPSTSTSGK